MQRRPASIHDVARLAGVSTATVSRVLNTPAIVARDTAARVEKAIAELAYKPNVFAQGLMTRRSRIIGFALPDMHGQFYSEMLRGANAEARRLGYHLLVSSDVSDGDDGLLVTEAAGLLGGLAVMVTEPNQLLWRRARESSLPVIVIDRDVRDDGVDSVLIDSEVGTREAVAHLLESVAPDRCWFVGGPPDNYDTQQRADSFLLALRERGGAPDARRTLFQEYTADWGDQAAAELLGQTGASTHAPIGILAGNDEIAYGILRAAQRAGVSVPSALRLIGFDDTYLASLTSPRLSSVRVPMAQVGAAAIEMLVRRVETPDAPAECRRLPTQLTVRESSSPRA